MPRSNRHGRFGHAKAKGQLRQSRRTLAHCLNDLRIGKTAATSPFFKEWHFDKADYLECPRSSFVLRHTRGFYPRPILL